MLSPSRSMVNLPEAAKACSRVIATVLLPDPLKPVNLQIATEYVKKDAFT